MTGPTRNLTLAAAALGFTGVLLGALGAHGPVHAALLRADAVENWKTAVLYHLVHAVALLALAGWRDAHGGPGARVAVAWIAGIVLFSGSIYALSLGGPRFLGPVTPLGGLALLAGWLLLAARAWRGPRS
jgi:uncharacterized membrane protein YgdD (TMEM256/DUF423 family)